MNADQSFAPCGIRGCPNPHPAQRWAERPLARRLALLHQEPLEDNRPEWLKRGTAKALDHSGSAA